MLRAKPPSAARTFVFLHIPPRLNGQYKVRRLKESIRIEAILEEHKVDYVFAGDYHGQIRIEKNNVKYIITGGGGAHIKYPERAGGFHHAVLVTVSPEWVSERLVAVERNEQFSDRLEHLAGVLYYPICRDHPFAVGIGNLFLIIAFLGILWPMLCKAPIKSLQNLL